VRAEPKNIGTADENGTATLPQRHCLNDKLSACIRTASCEAVAASKM